jgi:hypothetical protein
MNNNTNNSARETNDDINPTQKPKHGTLYKITNGLLIINDCFKGVPRQFQESTRSDIGGFSIGAGNRMRRYLRECLSDYRIMLTLTYPGFYPGDGKMVKEHLRRFCQELKRYSSKRKDDPEKFSAFWFLEFQARGAPHFHLFVTHEFPHEWVANVWYQIVGSEDDRHLRAGTRIETIRAGKHGIMAYASKYAAKNEQKEVPEDYRNVGRFWGVYGRRAVMSAATFVDNNGRRADRLSRPMFMLTKQVNQYVSNGDVVLVARHVGSAVFAVLTHAAMAKIAARICQLACATSRSDNMLDDAELDYGEMFNLKYHDHINEITNTHTTIQELIELTARNRAAR